MIEIELYPEPSGELLEGPNQGSNRVRFMFQNVTLSVE